MPKRLRDKNCERCSQPFQTRRPEAKWCSRKCVFAETRGPDYNAALAKKHNPDRNRRARGTGKKAPYVKRDGRHEHRIVAEEKIGRPLRRGEIVHHIDGDSRNNHPDNLAVMTQSEHVRLHARERANGLG